MTSDDTKDWAWDRYNTGEQLHSCTESYASAVISAVTARLLLALCAYIQVLLPSRLKCMGIIHRYSASRHAWQRTVRESPDMSCLMSINDSYTLWSKKRSDFLRGDFNNALNLSPAYRAKIECWTLQLFNCMKFLFELARIIWSDIDFGL